jgi:hypothetical protein
VGRRRIGIDGKQDERVRTLRVRRVDPGGRAHESVTGLRDHERWPRPYDLTGLAENNLDPARITVCSKLHRTLRRLDPAEVDDTTLDLRDCLLGDDEHVVGLDACLARGIHEERSEVVPLLELRDPVKRDHA